MRGLGDLSGGVADLGVLIPLTAALVVVNGMPVGPALIGVGALLLVAGAIFRIPFPVQPLKALTALAIAGGLAPDVIHAAGLLIGAILVLLAVTGLASRAARLFTKSVIRSLQLGVGALLVWTAARLVVSPPPVFAPTPPQGVAVALAALTFAGVAVAVWRRWDGVPVIALLVGVAITWAVSRPSLGGPALTLPELAVPDTTVWWTAFVLLVVPQLPLTFANAVVGVSDLAQEHFGPRASRVTPRRVALSAGLGNVGAGIAGGMPMCHGSSGLSSHVRLGARSARMNTGLGVALLVIGLLFADHALALFGLLPIWALAGFLAYAGLRHGLLVLDLPRRQLAFAVLAAAAGILTGNLAVTTAVALAAEHLPRAQRLRRDRSGGPLSRSSQRGRTRAARWRGAPSKPKRSRSLRSR